MNLKMVLYSLLLLCFIKLNAGIVDITDIEQITNAGTLGLKGYIRNIQVSPFNKDLMSFELTGDEDESISLYLYNRSKKRLFKVESQEIINKKVSTNQDRSLYWHPTDNWFVFSGNAGNKKNIYICRLADEDLNNKYAVKGYLMKFGQEFNKEGKPIKTEYTDPVFSSDGENVFFIRRLYKKGETAVLCKTANSESAKANNFDDLSFEVIAKKDFDIEKPLPSPKIGNNIIAYVLHRNKFNKKNKDFYLNYSIQVIDADTKEEAEVNDCSGFTSYSHFWNNTGEFLYYYKSIPLEKTPQASLDLKENILNLYSSKITMTNNKLFSILQSNQLTGVIMQNVSDRGLATIDDGNLLVPTKTSEGDYLIVSVNLDKWKNRDKDYSDTLDLTYPSYYPLFNKFELFFVSYKQVLDDFVDMISSAKIKLNFPSGTAAVSQPVAQVKSVIEKPVEKKIENPKITTPAETSNFKEKLITVLEQNDNLSLPEIMGKMNISADDEDKTNQLSKSLLEIAEIVTIGNKRSFALKNQEVKTLTPEVPESNLELDNKMEELITYKDKSNKIATDLSNSIKEKESNSQLLNDLNSERSKKIAEAADLEQRIKNIREAGNNQLVKLNTELSGLKTALQKTTSELNMQQNDLASTKKAEPELVAKVAPLKAQLTQLEAMITNLKKDKQAARDKVAAADKKAREEAAIKAKADNDAKLKAENEARLQAEKEAKLAADKEAQVKAEKNKKTADDYEEYVEEDEEIEEDAATPQTTPLKVEPSKIKKRR